MQKISLAFCLCLTVVVMACTIARICGLSYYNTVDASWETFWQYMSASLGLTLTSIAAFRSLFVSHRVSHRRQETSDLEALRLLYARVTRALRRTFSFHSWETRGWPSKGGDNRAALDTDGHIDLGKIERGTITGLRSFIHRYQPMPATASDFMSSQIVEEVGERHDTWPLPNQIAVQAVPADHMHGKPSSINESGRHEKMPTSEESRRHHKILAHKGSRRHDKMLNSQESRRQDKMLTRQETDTHEKDLVMDDNGKYDLALTRPAKVRNLPVSRGESSVLATGDSGFDGSGHWFRGSANGKIPPKTRVGIMSKMSCGGFVCSAGFKAERYRDEE